MVTVWPTCPMDPEQVRGALVLAAAVVLDTSIFRPMVLVGRGHRVAAPVRNGTLTAAQWANRAPRMPVEVLVVADHRVFRSIPAVGHFPLGADLAGAATLVVAPAAKRSDKDLVGPDRPGGAARDQAATATVWEVRVVQRSPVRTASSQTPPNFAQQPLVCHSCPET